jgi:hypothetical protein
MRGIGQITMEEFINGSMPQRIRVDDLLTVARAPQNFAAASERRESNIGTKVPSKCLKLFDCLQKIDLLFSGPSAFNHPSTARPISSSNGANMNRLLTALTAVCGLVAASPAAHADTIPFGPGEFAGGAGLIAGGTRIKFDPNIPGETATFTLASVPGTQYVISVTGQSNQSASFIQVLIDRDGPGTTSGFVQLGSNINFGSGFQTVTLPAFTDLGTADSLRLMNGGSGNGEIQISNITVTPVAVSGPIVGAGIPGLVGLALFLLARHRQKRVAL